MGVFPLVAPDTVTFPIPYTGIPSWLYNGFGAIVPNYVLEFSQILCSIYGCSLGVFVG